MGFTWLETIDSTFQKPNHFFLHSLYSFNYQQTENTTLSTQIQQRLEALGAIRKGDWNTRISIYNQTKSSTSSESQPTPTNPPSSTTTSTITPQGEATAEQGTLILISFESKNNEKAYAYKGGIILEGESSLVPLIENTKIYTLRQTATITVGNFFS